jgi:hypothetical protein
MFPYFRISPAAVCERGMHASVIHDGSHVRQRTPGAVSCYSVRAGPTGGRAYGYRDGKVDRGEAFMVLEIFGKFAVGMSARTIAADFNARRILSQLALSQQWSAGVFERKAGVLLGERNLCVMRRI